MIIQKTNKEYNKEYSTRELVYTQFVHE